MTTPSAIELLIDDTGLVVASGFSWITKVFTLITSNPLILIPVGFSILGIVIKIGKKFIK